MAIEIQNSTNEIQTLRGFQTSDVHKRKSTKDITVHELISLREQKHFPHLSVFLPNLFLDCHCFHEKMQTTKQVILTPIPSFQEILLKKKVNRHLPTLCQKFLPDFHLLCLMLFFAQY